MVLVLLITAESMSTLANISLAPMINFNSKMNRLKRIQKFTIIIPGIFIAGLIISTYAERFRGDKNLYWIYSFGKDCSLLFCYGAVLWSIVNSILISRDLKIDKPKKVFWFLLSASTFLYIIIMMTIAKKRNVD